MAENAGSSFHQSVTSVNGFAYGVQHADIHVFENGQPLYLLANWRGEPDADPNWLRQLPSRMLNARRAVVPFTGRADELAELRGWRDSGPRLRVHWLHGPGGQGKTRLAAQLAGESLRHGWKVVAAHHGPDADPPVAGSQDLSLAGAAGLLMIVDYADRWLLSNLTWLFKNALLHHFGVPTRLLLIGRGLDAWSRICGILDTYQADTTSQNLPDLPPDGLRATMFTTARDRFAAIYQHPGAATLVPPGHLDEPEYGLTLAVHMAALSAVDAAAHGERPPETMDGLTRYLLNREQLHWHRLYQDGAADTASTYATPARTMNQVVFTAALTGAQDRVTGAALLGSLDVGGDVDQVLTDHAVCYPPSEDSHDRATVLEPLYPDRLSEDFLALTMPGHRTDYPATDWAPGAATALLMRDQRAPDYLRRAVTYLASATHRWPHLAHTYLYPVLLDHPGLALTAGGTALHTLASSRHVTIELLEAVEPLLPAGRHVDLDIAAATIVTALTRHRLAHATDPGEQARLHIAHGYRLSNAGRREEALAAAEEAVRIRRRLVELDPDAHLLDLAEAMSLLGTFQSELGRREQAVVSTAEAGQLYLRADDITGLASFAASLRNLAGFMSELGRWEEALTVGEDAVRIVRRLAEANRDAYLPGLADAVHNLAGISFELGNPMQALLHSLESTNLYYELVEADSSNYLPLLAGSLHNFGNYLFELGQREQAVAAAAQAVDIGRRLAKANPDAYLADLARSLRYLAYLLSVLGQGDAALGTATEAVAVARELTGTNLDAHLPGLANALWAFGSVCVNASVNLAEALDAMTEAITLYESLADRMPAAFTGRLLAARATLADVLDGLGRTAEAAALRQQSMLRGSRLGAGDSDSWSN